MDCHNKSVVIQIPNHPESEFFGGKKILEVANSEYDWQMEP